MDSNLSPQEEENNQETDEWVSEEDFTDEPTIQDQLLEAQQQPLIELQGNQEEEKCDPSWIPLDQIKHCSHYIRWCDKQAPCCNIYYPCRLCHNDLYKGPKAPGCKIEVMPRQEVKLVRCRRCLNEQAPSKKCDKCNIVFARYYCSICKFYDDGLNKEIYHCNKCNMCRRGVKEENFHCEKCDICLSLSIKDGHKCTEGAFVQVCPVCQMNLKESVQGVQQMPTCQHWIHSKCLQEYISKGKQNRCPICNTALQVQIIIIQINNKIQKMSQGQIKQIDKYVQETSDKLPQEVQDMKVSIQCLECHKDTKDLPFHIYLKCSHCGTYNTKQ